MKKILLLAGSILLLHITYAENIPVKNIAELLAADKKAKPGDIIILQNGVWQNNLIELSSKGTRQSPIIFKAATEGKVIFSGKSSLRIGGEYIEVQGISFLNGYSPAGAVWEFRLGNTLANYCRITHCIIDNFNNEKRTYTNDWISFYGKYNRVDHCRLLNKKNFGVLLAVLMDDERSRESFHSIDNNYFGKREPLGSNGGEIIRVGLAQHCTFNSNTVIEDNVFDRCDGEAEVISIKSGGNFVRRNVFNECQGSLVLRHGNNNTVEENVFLGNGKRGTGGVRIINEGNWVVNNLFYGCRGDGFRSPMAVMNGVFNSPPTRYVQVKDAVLANNTFINCAPFSLCEGSDSERAMIPKNVFFINNLFLNNSDSLIYFAFDKTDSIYFNGNLVNNSIRQQLKKGFTKTNMSTEDFDGIGFPVLPENVPAPPVSDSIRKLASKRLVKGFPYGSGCSVAILSSNGYANFVELYGDRKKAARIEKRSTQNYILSDCKSTAEILLQLQNKEPNIIIHLTGTQYNFDQPLAIKKSIIFTAVNKSVQFLSNEGTKLPFAIQLLGGGQLVIRDAKIDMGKLNASTFIMTDTSGPAEHVNFAMNNVTIENFKGGNGFFFYASKSSMADSVVIRNSFFKNNTATLFDFCSETEKKGICTVESLTISNNHFENQDGTILDMLRNGVDESTLGPLLVFDKNEIKDSKAGSKAIIQLTGTQQSYLTNNSFIKTNPSGTLIQYIDYTRASHILQRNKFDASGNVVRNKYVVEENNIVQ